LIALANVKQENLLLELGDEIAIPITKSGIKRVVASR
jgi:hypothetical protein